MLANKRNVSKSYNIVKSPRKNYWMETQQDRQPVIAYEINESSKFSIEPYSPVVNQISVYENVVHIQDSSGEKPFSCPPIRETFDIKCFSKNSRLRLLRLTSKIPLNKYADILHCTFTFHNDFPTDTEVIRTMWAAWWKRLNAAYPDFDFIWRIEFQKRGAPHWHIVFLSRTKKISDNIEYFRLPLSRLWLAFIGENSFDATLYAVSVTHINESRKFFAYISKYSAKVEEEIANNYRGRRWGYSPAIPFDPQKVYHPSDNLLLIFKRRLFSFLSARKKLSLDFQDQYFHGTSINIFLNAEDFHQIYNDSLSEFQGCSSYLNIDTSKPA